MLGYIGEDLFRWALESLRDWQNTATRTRGRQTFPRFLVLKRLGVPADGQSGDELSTNDFHQATRQLFGIADENQAQAAGMETMPFYLNPLTGAYQRGPSSADWAIGTLWTRSGTDGSLSFEGDKQRRYRFEDDYLTTISNGLGSKVPLWPLLIFLARQSSTWSLPPEFGFVDAADLKAKLIAGLSLSASELDALFEDAGQPTLPLRQQELTADAAFAIARDVFPPPAPSQVPTVVVATFGDGTSKSSFPNGPSPSVDWTRTFEGADPCGLKGLAGAFEKARGALAAGKHVVFYGPPGTGKSQLAECLCRTLGAKFLLTTATSDWTTFDTIGGYFPKEASASGQLSFMPGVLVESFKEDRWVIIDEMNRADLDKAFGQLFSILAGQTVTLPYLDPEVNPPKRLSIGRMGTGASVEVSSDWRLIGTMNTFDKSSLFQLSYALMRRFAFVEVPAPTSATLQEIMAVEMANWPQDGREAVGESLIGVFCDPQGLRSANREVGAAIALDICRAVGSAPNPEITTGDLVELLDMYLFPQFEGMEREHAKVLSALKTTLSLDEPGTTSLQRKLAAWTGHRQ